MYPLNVYNTFNASKNFQTKGKKKKRKMNRKIKQA